MRVLVACEFSQIVTKAFRAKGHEAFSCDLLPTEGNPDWHIQGDVFNDVLWAGNEDWDLIIAHPPCTHLAVSGARWFKDKIWEQREALSFVHQFMVLDI
jgi:site-specific DNA-cytosine methylase